MKNTCWLMLALFLLVSCAAKSMEDDKKTQIGRATQRLGEGYYNAGNYTAALKNLLEAETCIPDDPFVHNSLGLVYLAKKKYKLAQDQFQTALDIRPDYSQARNNLGVSYLKQEKWDPAIRCFETVLESLLYPTPEMPMANLGAVYLRQGKREKAETAFKKASEIRPDFLMAIHGLASVYIENGYYDQAVRFLSRSLKKNPGAAILHSDLAKVYEARREYDNARKAWGIVIKLVPENSPLAREAHKRLFEMN